MCQNCVASLFLLLFLTFCVVRDHEAMGSNPVTPTIKNTHALFALCVFYLPEIRDLNGTLRKQHSALFLVPGVITTALAAQKKAYETPAPVGLRSKSRHSDHKKHTRIICVVCFLFARNKGFERCCKLKFFVQFDLNENKKTSGRPLVQPDNGISAKDLKSLYSIYYRYFIKSTIKPYIFAMKNPRRAVGFIRYLRLLLRLRFGRLHHISVFHAVCNLIQKFRVV